MNPRVADYFIVTLLLLHGQVGQSTYSQPVVLTSDVLITVQAGPAQSEPPSKEKRLQTNSWRGLVPLQSTRMDVERLLGKAKSSGDVRHVYETENESVDILYSAGPCKLSAVERWNVPPDVILRIDVRPTSVLIQDLHLDQARYPRLQLSHPQNWARYMNDDDGVMVETITEGKAERVYLITYWPRTKDKALRCPK